MLGERIAERRQQLGWSKIYLARKLGIEPIRIYEWENGKKHDCTLSTARRLARVLGCSLDYLGELTDPTVDPEPLPELPPPRPRGRPRKQPVPLDAPTALPGVHV